MRVGDRIKGLRKNIGISQKELANRANISQAALHYIENGANSPTVKTLNKIAGALGVSQSALLDDLEAKASGE